MAPPELARDAPVADVIHPFEISLRPVLRHEDDAALFHGLDGGFGQNPALLATAYESDIAVIWVVMNNRAFGTIAGLQKAHFGTTVGTVFEKNGQPYSADFAAVARAYGVEGERVESADGFRPALERAVASGRPYLLDVIMENAPVPTAGWWNIMDIYSPGQGVTHATT